MANPTVTNYLQCALCRSVDIEEATRRMFKENGWREAPTDESVTAGRITALVKGPRRITIVSFHDRMLHAVRKTFSLEIPGGWVRVVYDAIDAAWVCVRDCEDYEIPPLLVPMLLVRRVVDDLTNEEAKTMLNLFAQCADIVGDERAATA